MGSAIAGIAVFAGAALVHRITFEPLPNDVQADRVVIHKESRKLTLYRAHERLKSYDIALGRDPAGHKQFEGDGRTPEGRYTIDFRKEDSSFHRALHISYPSSDDQRAAEAIGESPGGDIMIHGLRNGLGFVGPVHRLFDWTEGCIAVTNAEIDELWRAVPDGTPVEIGP